MSDFPGLSCPAPLGGHDRVLLAHGGGGGLTHALIEQVFLPAFGNPLLAPLGDASVLAIDGLAAGERLAFSTDSFVVQPLFFPGGSIGDLAVHGTVNDLAMAGARPLWLSAAFVIEEGLPITALAAIATAMAHAADRAGVRIVTGDTKVVERGRGDGCLISTAGLGVVPAGVDLGPARIRPGDAILVSGPLGDHGMTIMATRASLGFEADLVSDTAPLQGLVATLLAACPDVRLLRDPTRGGLAASLCEIAGATRLGVEVHESAVPVRPAVATACEMLGLDPLEVASEGRLLAVVPSEAVPAALAAIGSHELGQGAALIGGIVTEHPGVVVMRTRYGLGRLISMPLGEHLPRIC
jgi:hydrogenase expression/formation protein HypE